MIGRPVGTATYEELLAELAAAEANMKLAEAAGDRDDWHWCYEAKLRAEHDLRRFKRVDT